MTKHKGKIRLLLSIFLGVLAGIIAGVIFIPLAYAERGYYAVGGKWLLIIAADVLATYAVYKLDKWFCQKLTTKN